MNKNLFLSILLCISASTMALFSLLEILLPFSGVLIILSGIVFCLCAQYASKSAFYFHLITSLLGFAITMVLKYIAGYDPAGEITNAGVMYGILMAMLVINPATRSVMGSK